MRRRRFLQATGGTGAAVVAGCLENGDGDGDDGGVGGGDDDGNGGGGDGNGDDNGGGDGEEAPIGALQPLSGPFSSWGQAHQVGLEVAIEEANAGGDLEHEFDIASADSESSPSEAATLFSRFVEQDGCVAITGVVSSDVGIRTAQLAEEMEVPNLLHMSGTHAALTKDSRYTFRVGWPPAPTHVRADVEFVEDRGFESVGAIIADYAWGRAVEASMERFFPDDIDVHVEAAPVTEDDFSPYLRSMPDVDVMTHVGHPPGSVSIVRQQLELGIDVPTTGVDPPQRDLYSALGEDVTRNIYTRHLVDVESDEFHEFGEGVAERDDFPVYAYEPIGYITGQLFVEAVENAGTDPVAIAEYVRETTFETLYAAPIEYTEWGELDGQILTFTEFELEPPSYYPDGDFRLNPVFQTSPLEAYDPEEFPLD